MNNILKMISLFFNHRIKSEFPATTHNLLQLGGDDDALAMRALMFAHGLNAMSPLTDARTCSTDSTAMFT